MIPQRITDPDLGVRTPTLYDLEKTLVAFIKQVVAEYRFDNPTLNLAQSAEPVVTPQIYSPDEPPVPFDPEARAQTLALKVPPRVERGRLPRTVTGEIDAQQLSNFPSIIVQVVSGHVAIDQTTVTVRILVNMYDENPNSGGYQDCLNITEALAVALTSYGQGAIDQAFPIVLPIEWSLIEQDTFPHFIAEMTTRWTLESARPMPDDQITIGVPSEQFGFGMSHDEFPDRPEVATPE